EVETDVGNAGAAEIVDDDGVSASQGIELDGLHASDIHEDVGDVAKEAQARAVGREFDRFADDGSVEQEGVASPLALDQVVGVAGVPDEGVGVVATHEHIVSTSANENVGPWASIGHVVDESRWHA